ncbi:hypothetical protein FACS189446_2040 [Bacteroidia bacterium]|nr:hypothetical protein FACS189446_2040 [Bacteroidia bacterium]
MYIVKFTRQANKDIRAITSYVKDRQFAPIAAKIFLRGIYARIADLEKNAAIYAISTYEDVLFYGDNARQIGYKGFVIIYTIHGRFVLVHRIIHGSLIIQ